MARTALEFMIAEVSRLEYAIKNRISDVAETEKRLAFMLDQIAQHTAEVVELRMGIEQLTSLKAAE